MLDPVYNPLASVAVNVLIVAFPEGATNPIVALLLVLLTIDRLVGGKG